MKYFKVCGVVVTYNRKELLLRNIQSLLMQTYPLDILIYDNASTDGTYDFLKEHDIFEQKNIIYIRGESNLGGAGGFCNGEKNAIKRGYDYLWLMDDDGYCVNSKTLENLVLKCNEEKEILNSFVLCDKKTKKPTFNIGGCKTFEEVCKKFNESEIIGLANPYNGTLVPRKCFEEIGYTDERFFIYGDEYDFVARSKKVGYKWKTVVDSLYFHPVNRNIIKEISLLGHNFDVKDQPIWKWYLETRNSTYNSVTHNNNKVIIYFYIRVFLVSLNSKNKKFKRLYYGILGVKDALKNKFDRPIMFKI